MSYADAAQIAGHIAEVVPLARPGSPRMVTQDEVDFSETVDGPPAQGPPDEIPAHLLDVPGAVGHITRWITKTALFPQPMLALGAALAVVGTAAGRKYAGPTGSGTHLYVLGLAGTGAGKNHPAKVAKRIMRAASMDENIGPGQFMSEPAVYQRLALQPLLLCFMDEFGSYLSRVNNPKGSGYERAISGALRTMWGASFDRIDPPAWADNTKTLKPIQSPSLSIYGMSVHDEFYAALQSADIANGFLNRFLILSTMVKPVEVEPELPDNDVPTVIVEMLGRIAAATPFRRAVSDGWAPEIKLDWETADARLAYVAFRTTVSAREADAKLLSRVPEMAVRLATIRAIGRDASKPSISGPRVSVEDIAWGCELALWSAERMIGDAAAYMVESEHQGRTLEVARYIKAAPRRRLTMTELSGKIRHKYDSRTLRSILESLQETDQVEVTRVAAKPPARKPTDYIQWVGK